MRIADRAVWCVVCGSDPEYAISAERNGVIAHWGSCPLHLMQVCARVLSDRDSVEHERLRQQADLDRSRAPVVEVDETTTYEIEAPG